MVSDNETQDILWKNIDDFYQEFYLKLSDIKDDGDSYNFAPKGSFKELKLLKASIEYDGEINGNCIKECFVLKKIPTIKSLEMNNFEKCVYLLSI